jgi:excisionase family DNA binding protein
MQSDEKLVYTVEEAGERLGLGRNASYGAVGRGEIPSIRIGRLIRVPKIALDQMLAAAADKRRS